MPFLGLLTPSDLKEFQEAQRILIAEYAVLNRTLLDENEQRKESLDKFIEGTSKAVELAIVSMNDRVENVIKTFAQLEEKRLADSAARIRSAPVSVVKKPKLGRSRKNK
jgi:hypothetical protein